MNKKSPELNKLKKLNNYLKLSQAQYKNVKTIKNHQKNAENFALQGMVKESNQAYKMAKNAEKNSIGSNKIYNLHTKALKLKSNIQTINRELKKLKNIQKERNNKMIEINKILQEYSNLKNQSINHVR